MQLAHLICNEADLTQVQDWDQRAFKYGELRASVSRTKSSG